MDPDRDGNCNPGAKRSWDQTTTDLHTEETSSSGRVAKQANTQSNSPNTAVLLRQCRECLEEKCKTDFSIKQWKFAASNGGNCKDCAEKLKLAQALANALPPTLTCAVCGNAKDTKKEFYRKERQRGSHATCTSCVLLATTLKCAMCQKNKEMKCFSKKDRDQGNQATCKHCLQESGTLTCESCRKVKKKLFFDGQQQQMGEKAKCRNCCDREFYNKERKQLEMERARIPDEYKDSPDITKRQLYANGPQVKMPTFQPPGSGYPLDDDSDKVSPNVEFERSCPEESLIGEYDLIFYYAIGVFDPLSSKNRATKGWLKFEMDGDGKIHGSLSVNKELRSDMPYHMGDEVKIGPDFMVSNIDEIICVDELDDVRVDVDRVAERHAVKYMPEGDGLPESEPPFAWRRRRRRGKKYAQEEDPESTNFLKDYFDSIQFETPEEAEELLNRHNEPPLWMANHLKLPSCLARLIQEFVGKYKPPPALIFEKGDIFVEFHWFEHIVEGYSSTFVARPR